MASEGKSFLSVLLLLVLFCLLLFVIYLPQPEEKRVKADLTDCAENLKKVYAALLMYQEKYGSFPSGPDTDGLEPLFQLQFDRDLTHFVCPGTSTQTRGELRNDTLSYYYFPPSNGKPAAGEVLLCDHPGNHPGGMIQLLYGDGSILPYRLSKPVPRKEIPGLARKRKP